MSASERRTCFSAHMPECDDFENRSADAVVDEVLDAREVQSSNYLGTRRLDFGADAGLFNEQGQGRLYILAHGSWRGEPILGPPLCCSFDLALRARLDSDAERQNSAEATKPREKLFGRDAFFSVGLIEGGKKFGFLLGRKLHNCLIASGNNSDGRSLWQGEPLHDDFATNYGA